MLDVLDRAGHSRLPAFNEAAVERLREAATLLSYQDDNAYRVAAYRRAGDAVAAQTADLRALLEGGGIEALEEIPGVGRRIAGGLPNWHGQDGGPIWNGCAAPLSRTMSFALYRESGRSCPSACTKRFTWKRSSNWKRPCTRRMDMPSRDRSATIGNPACRAGANASSHPRRTHRTRRRAPSGHAARHRP